MDTVPVSVSYKTSSSSQRFYLCSKRSTEYENTSQKFNGEVGQQIHKNKDVSKDKYSPKKIIYGRKLVNQPLNTR